MAHKSSYHKELLNVTKLSPFNNTTVMFLYQYNRAIREKIVFLMPVIGATGSMSEIQNRLCRISFSSDLNRASDDRPSAQTHIRQGERFNTILTLIIRKSLLFPFHFEFNFVF